MIEDLIEGLVLIDFEVKVELNRKLDLENQFLDYLLVLVNIEKDGEGFYRGYYWLIIYFLGLS